MKLQYKVAVCSSLTFILCAIVSCLLICFKGFFIEKWADYFIAISLGLLTNSVLIFVISVISFYQIRRENSRKIIIELNILLEKQAMLNALMLPFINDAGEINIPDSELHIIETSLAQLDDISLRVLYLERISQPTYLFSKRGAGSSSKIVTTETSFFKELSELIRQCHIGNSAFKLAYYINDPVREEFKPNFQNSIQRIYNYSNESSTFVAILKDYLDINYKILKITKVDEGKRDPK